MQEFLRERGGLRITRHYSDATAASTGDSVPSALTWQGRCRLDASSSDRGAAEAAFVEKLGRGIEFEWGADGALSISHNRSAFNEDGDWCNVLKVLSRRGTEANQEKLPGSVTAADGTPVPPELLEGLDEAEAGAYRALRLEAGDVWLMDNLRVAHGRLPYTDGNGGTRTLFAFLADRV